MGSHLPSIPFLPRPAPHRPATQLPPRRHKSALFIATPPIPRASGRCCTSGQLSAPRRLDPRGTRPDRRRRSSICGIPKRPLPSRARPAAALVRPQRQRLGLLLNAGSTWTPPDLKALQAALPPRPPRHAAQDLQSHGFPRSAIEFPLLPLFMSLERMSPSCCYLEKSSNTAAPPT